MLEYLGKLSYNIFGNISYLPLYCHLVETDGFKLVSAVCAEKAFVTQVNGSLQNQLQ
jgi:hypothetical protein